MATIFKYKNKIYQAINLDKKLKRLKVSENDIEILFQGELSQSELEKKFLELTNSIKEIPTENWHNPNLYYFKNIKTNETIVSIYPTLDNLKNIINISEWMKEN